MAPATLGTELVLRQRLSFERGGQRQYAEALLEIDADALRLLLVSGPQRLLWLRWDGSELVEERAAELPAELQGQRVIDDIQLAYWPASLIRQELPAGWSLQDAPQRRELRHRGQTVVSVDYSGPERWLGEILIERPQFAASLRIESREDAR